MKVRHGFVSNSSSSSFVVSIDALTEDQIEKLMNYGRQEETFNGKYSGPDSNYDDCYFGDAWRIDRDDRAHLITGFTIMDNCDMSKYMREVCDIDLNLVRFEGD